MAHATAPPEVFRFRRDRPFSLVSRPFGVTDATARVEVHADRLVARFGPWCVDTPLANVRDVQVTGPYAWWKVIGPPRLSLADRGLTFATSSAEGVCVTFHEPVRGADPSGRLRHPGLTVTVAEPQRLVEAVTRRLPRHRQEHP